MEITDKILLTTFIIALLVVIVSFYFLRIRNDDKFDIWYLQLLDCAPGHGYTAEEIKEFDEAFWYMHYSEGLGPCEALETEKYS